MMNFEQLTKRDNLLNQLLQGDLQHGKYLMHKPKNPFKGIVKIIFGSFNIDRREGEYMTVDRSRK